MHAVAIEPIGLGAGGWTQRRPAVLVNDTPTPAVANFSEMIAGIAARTDRQAFIGLFSHFAPRVKSYMLRLGCSPSQAEELAQETLLTVWRKAATFDPAKAAPSTWIFTIARNLRIDALRRERRPEPAPDPSEAPDADPAPDAALAASQSEGRVRHAMLILPAEQAEVVRLSFFSDKPHSEIAAELGLPLGTVKSRLRLAMGRLREELGDLA
jgi:RNA polymerase sigma-70 factor (ECF subfamily)